MKLTKSADTDPIEKTQFQWLEVAPAVRNQNPMVKSPVSW